MTERKTAPKEVMLVGYYLTEARNAFAGATDPYDGNRIAYGYAYLTSAMGHVEAARKSLEKDLEGRRMWPGDGLYDLDVACEMARQIVGLKIVPVEDSRPVSNLIAKGHLKLAKMMFKFGYAPITDDDFNKLRRTENLPGAGGGR